MIFFLALTVRGPFHRKYFKWKKIWGTGLVSEKTEVLYAELNERAEAANSSYSGTGDFLQYIYSVPVTKSHQIKVFLVNEFSLADFFLMKLIKKILCGCFRLHSCGYLLLLWKGAQNGAHCNSIIPPYGNLFHYLWEKSSSSKKLSKVKLPLQ